MIFDAADAGVGPGGLVSQSEIRILICYILDTIKEPVPATELCELLYYEKIANIFEVSDCIEYLESVGHIVKSSNDSTSYTITKSGSEIAAALKTTVSLSVRERACLATVKMLAKIRNAKETDIAISREGDLTYITCSALDNGMPIVSVKLLVNDEAQAGAIKTTFLENPTEIYLKIIDLFTN